MEAGGAEGGDRVIDGALGKLGEEEAMRAVVAALGGALDRRFRRITGGAQGLGALEDAVEVVPERCGQQVGGVAAVEEVGTRVWLGYVAVGDGGVCEDEGAQVEDAAAGDGRVRGGVVLGDRGGVEVHSGSMPLSIGDVYPTSLWTVRSSERVCGRATLFMN